MSDLPLHELSGQRLCSTHETPKGLTPRFRVQLSGSPHWLGIRTFCFLKSKKRTVIVTKCSFLMLIYTYTSRDVIEMNEVWIENTYHEHSLGKDLTLLRPDNLAFMIFVIWVCIFLQIFSNSTTLHYIPCRWALRFSLSTERYSSVEHNLFTGLIFLSIDLDSAQLS